MNVYSFHVTVVSNSDKRERQKIRHEQEGMNLINAWDMAEKKLAIKFPNHCVSLSVGNRQPINLRPGFRQQALQQAG